MIKQKNLVPKRRFKDFSDELKTHILSEITDVYDGTHQTPKYTDEGVMFLSVENIDTLVSDKFISQEDFEKDFKNYPEKDDVLMTRIGSIGKTNVIETDEKLAYYVSLALLKTKNVYPKYLVASISSPSVQRELWKRTLHIAFPKKINKNEIENVEISIPSFYEQQQIGQFFKHLDEMITLEQRKIDKTKALKSAYLAEMFPAEGERVPKRRFEGFSEEWKDYKMKDIGRATGGTSIEAEFVKEGKYKVISIGSYSEQSVYTDQNIRVNISDKIKKRILNKNDLTMILNDKTVSGNIIGRVLLIDKDDSYVYNQRTARIEPDNIKFDIQFLYQFLNAPLIRRKIINQAQGNTQIYVNWTMIEELHYSIPVLEEQKKIGAFFKRLDDSIKNHQQKLDKLKATKQAYLHEMFV